MNIDDAICLAVEQTSLFLKQDLQPNQKVELIKHIKNLIQTIDDAEAAKNQAKPIKSIDDPKNTPPLKSNWIE